MTGIVYRQLSNRDFDKATQFYSQVGYQPKINPADQILGALLDEKLIGVVRLSEESGIQVLRGMQIDPQFRRQQIGTALLKEFENMLGTRICYCLPYRWLENFYGSIGFRKIDIGDGVPAFLTERLKNYQDQGLDVVLMKRSSNLESNRQKEVRC